MPIYAYRCASCGHEKDVLQKMSDAPLKQCPACGKDDFSKQVTAAGFQLKGSGWYVTDFRGGSNGGNSGGGNKDAGASAAKSDSASSASDNSNAGGSAATASTPSSGSAAASATAAPAASASASPGAA